jgi:hypothetical protein
MEKIQEISREYFENDPSVLSLITFLYSPRFTAAWDIFTTSPEIEDIFEWMGNHGVNVESEINIFSEEVKRLSSNTIRRRMIQGFSIKSFEEEMKSQINFEDLNDTIDELLKAGNDFAHLYLILSVTRSAIEKVFEEPEIQEIVEHLTALGIDLEGLKDFVYQMFRWN